MEKNRKFDGNGTKVGNYDLINLSIKKSALEGNWFEYNGEHYVKLTVGALKETSEYGRTHSVWINDYKPDPAKAKAKAEDNVQEVDLPF